MFKILFVEGCTDGTVGGSHFCLFDLVINLDKSKYHPIVLFYDENIVQEKLKAINIDTRIINKRKPLDLIKAFNLQGKSNDLMSFIFLMIQKIINLIFYFCIPVIRYFFYLKRNNIDIVHLNNSIKKNHEWMLAAFLLGRKCLTHERGINQQFSKTSRFLSRKIDGIICVSNYIRKNLINRKVLCKRILTVYDGINPDRFIVSLDSKTIKEKYGVKNDAPVIGVVGNIKEWKGQKTVVKATGILKEEWPDIKCYLVGTIPSYSLCYEKELKELCTDMKIENNVVFTGFQENVSDFMSTMDIVIHSSILPEPFGMVNLEAMYLRKPVIAANAGGPTEIFHDGEDGILVEPGSAKRLADEISLLLKDTERRKKIGEKAYAKVITKFNLSYTVHQIENIYEGILRDG